MKQSGGQVDRQLAGRATSRTCAQTTLLCTGSLHLVDHSASSSAAPLSCEYALESSQIPLDISRTVQTALDIPLTDTVARQLPSNGLLTTVHLTDCGLVWYAFAAMLVPDGGACAFFF